MIIYFAERSNIPLVPLKSVLKEYSKKFQNENDNTSLLIQCPAFAKDLKNTFIIQSHFDYEFFWDGVNVRSNLYDQKFFDECLMLRGVKHGLLSLEMPKYIFICEKDLNMSLINPYLENDSFCNNVKIVQGSFNIGKHFRTIEVVFFINEKGKITISEGSPLCYVKFDTDEKIIFKPFVYTSELDNLLASSLRSREITKKIKPLEWWYQINELSLRNKKYLEIVKKNLY